MSLLLFISSYLNAKVTYIALYIVTEMPMVENCGVFLNFRSEVRKNFTYHLFDALDGKTFFWGTKLMS